MGMTDEQKKPKHGVEKLKENFAQSQATLGEGLAKASFQVNKLRNAIQHTDRHYTGPPPTPAPEIAGPPAPETHPLRDAVATAAKTIFSPFGRGGAAPQAPAPGSNPPGSATPAPTSTPATAPEQPPAGTQPGATVTSSNIVNGNNVSALRGMGLTDAQINAPAVANSRTAIRAGFPEYTNLGNYGQQGGPNIYGRASIDGKPMDTFVGAGAGAGTEPGLNAQGQQVTGGTVYNPSGYNPQNPYGNAASSLRAGQRQFGGGAGGRGTIRAVDIRRINQQANTAFNQALRSGMNTKAAARIADNIRAGASQLTEFDKNLASRENTQTYADASRYGTDMNFAAQALRGQQAQAAAAQASALDAAEKQFSLFQDQFTDPEGNPDKAGFSRMVQMAGGRDRFMAASPETQQRLATRGSAINNILQNVNAFANKRGLHYSTLGEMTRGMQLKQTGVSLWDVLRSPDIGITQIFDDKLTLPNGDLIGVEDFLGVDKDTFAKMSAEDRNALIELTGE